MTLFYRHYQERMVYPGHPVLIGLEILHLYEKGISNIFGESKMLEYTPSISGNPDMIWQSVELIRQVLGLEITPSKALSLADEVWEKGHFKPYTKRTVGMRAVFNNGQRQANSYKAIFLNKLYKALSYHHNR